MEANSEEGFYKTLPSNPSLNMFTENIISDLQVELAQHVDFEGPWQVVLTEISYPHTWQNVPVKNTVFHWVDSWSMELQSSTNFNPSI